MNYQQLSFEFDFPKEEKTTFWKKHFDWEPEIGKTARVDSVIDFCETIGQDRYCYCMRVKVLEINGDTAKVETTEEWEKATSGMDKAGMIWKINIENLAPIFNGL